VGAEHVLLLADDLTGALEAGARFENSVVCLQAGRDSRVLVLDLESRHLAPEEAAARVRRACAGARAGIIFKKTDSTLRGNIGAELGALPAGTIHYVPAYPAQGRTVRGGKLFVHGVPVQQSPFAHDPTQPVATNDIRALLERQGAPLQRIEIHDGSTDGDVHAAAKRILKEPAPRLAAGPAALAGELAALLGLAPHTPDWPAVPACLVVNGSAHPASAAQLLYARQHGLERKGWRLGTRGEASGAPGALVLFGGDTAREILRGFGDPTLHPLGEIMPGVPVSWFAHEGRRWTLVTKAGGFGEPDLLVRLHAMLNRGSAGKGTGK
jgi:uncharacterized protein YgbK (DUF1537 family)